jgi:2-polyprenyl-3-methyl-5-hydroxy-6-metoxy-1,4-benzoquinol methylase
MTVLKERLTALIPPGDQDSYAINAEFWVKIIREHLDRFRTELTDETVFRAIGQCNGLRVLDVGCGEGYLSRELASSGANVTGLDTSDALIHAATAEAHRLTLPVKYYVAGVEAIPEDDHTFDIVVCNHVMTDVADPGPALKEIGRVTKTGGKLVILMLHPCFYTGNIDGRGGRDVSVASYFSTRLVTQQFRVAGINSPGEVRNTFRPLEQYMSALFEAGFVLTDLSEPHPTAEQLRDQWWQDNFTRPLFLLLEGERR